jgi:hypothetical protein
VVVDVSSTWTDIATVLGALFTALAAGAAWRAVAQTKRITDAAQRADLHPQLLLNRASGTTDLAIYNAGGGIAKGAAFVLVVGGVKGAGFLGDGFIRSGYKVTVHGSFPASDDAECIVSWRDADDTGWAVRRDRRKVQIGKGPDWEETGAQTWARLYPEQSIRDLPTLEHDRTMEVWDRMQ